MGNCVDGKVGVGGDGGAEEKGDGMMSGGEKVQPMREGGTTLRGGGPFDLNCNDQRADMNDR